MVRRRYCLIYKPERGDIAGWAIGNSLDYVRRRAGRKSVSDKLADVDLEQSLGKHDLGDGYVLLIDVDDE